MDEQNVAAPPSTPTPDAAKPGEPAAGGGTPSVPYRRTYEELHAFHAHRPLSAAPASSAQPDAGPLAGAAFGFMLAMLLVVGIAGALVVDRRVGVFNGGSADGAAAANPDEPVAAPLCDSVEEPQRSRLERGFGMVQRTADGRRLTAQLAAHDICVSVEPLRYHAGYAQARKAFFGGWSNSRVVIDDEVILFVEPDVLAATLVHEAAHIDRSISGAHCGAFDDCEVLANGITVEEEVAAHGAEARWWIAIYGPRGRRVNVGYGYSLDFLASAYLQGPEAFRAFVVSIRSDPEEGQGL